MALALFASLVAAAAATASPDRAGNPTATASVIGGHNTTIAQYPSLAYVEGVQATAGYACTGTVVAPRVVLTAGHCVEDIESSSIAQPGLIAVATGISNLKEITQAQVTQVTQVLAYPKFDTTEAQGDAGLLILATPVSAPPISLATKADADLYEAGHDLRIAGWGINKFGTEHAPNQLQAASVPIEKAANCERGTRRFYPFFDPTRQFCTLDPNHQVDFCHGDSGGPAIATAADGTPVEVGVISLNDGVCNPSNPAVYTRVDQISSWVNRWIDAVENGGTPPRINVPKVHIPVLTREHGEELGAIAMEEAFGSRFVHGQERSISCARLASARLKCGVTWFQGPNDYFGRVTLFYAIRHNVLLAGAHYKVNWVNDHCYFHSGHQQTCHVFTKQK